MTKQTAYRNAPALDANRARPVSLKFKRLIFTFLTVLPLSYAAPVNAPRKAVETSICVTSRLFILSTEVKLPPENDRGIEASLAPIGFWPAPCSIAKIRLLVETRIVGPLDRPRATFSIVGRSGGRVGLYNTEFPAEQIVKDEDHLIAVIALGLSSVIEQVDPGYTSRLAEDGRQEASQPSARLQVAPGHALEPFDPKASSTEPAAAAPATRPVCTENGSCYGDISNITGRPKTVHVNGYYRNDGTYVRGYYRSK